MRISEATVKRVLSALVALPVYSFFIWFGGFYYSTIFLLSTALSLACLFEYYQISSASGETKPFIIPGLVAGFFINVVVYIFAFGKVTGLSRYVGDFDARWLVGVFILFLCSVIIIQIFRRPLKGGIFALSSTVFGVVYIVLFFSHIILIRSLTDGFAYLFILNLVVMVNDSFAYFGGMLFGRHKTGFAVSPNKSWEGYFSGILFSIIAVLIANEVCTTFFGLALFGTFEAAFIGILLAVCGDLGDLIESAVKRDGKVKDSGTLIPGHGGMWDVFDALIFTMPLFYYYLKIRGVQ
jgi:phosphatidate cytidylyltransferase